MNAKLRQEIEEVLAEANLRRFCTELQPYFSRIMPLNDEAEDALAAIFRGYLASSSSPVRAMWKAFIVGVGVAKGSRRSGTDKVRSGEATRRGKVNSRCCSNSDVS